MPDEPILNKPSPPFLPYLDLDESKKQYTLVLDLDETIMHYKESVRDPSTKMFKNKISRRPGLKDFLKEISAYYEIVIFTASLPFVNIFLFTFFL